MDDFSKEKVMENGFQRIIATENFRAPKHVHTHEKQAYKAYKKDRYTANTNNTIYQHN